MVTVRLVVERTFQMISMRLFLEFCPIRSLLQVTTMLPLVSIVFMRCNTPSHLRARHCVHFIVHVIAEQRNTVDTASGILVTYDNERIDAHAQ